MAGGVDVNFKHPDKKVSLFPKRETGRVWVALLSQEQGGFGS